MLREFAMPDVGEGLTEAEVVTWNVAAGDVVTVNQVLCEIETAKAAVELPSPYAGTVGKLLVEPGQVVAVGSPIISIETAEAAAPAVEEDTGAKIGEVGKDGRVANLVGYGARPGAVTRRPRRGTTPPPAPPTPAPVQQSHSAATSRRESGFTAISPGGAGAGAAAGAVPLAKPPVRKLARDLGVDLRSVTPSGPGGVITRDDVQSHVVTPAAPAAVAAVGGVRREPIRGIRKHTAAAMVSSAFTAPHVTEFLAVDVTATMALRDRLRATREYAEVKLTPLAFVAKAVCLAARRTPELNARWDEAAGEIVYFDRMQLGIAAATPRGLIVPNVRDADTLTLRELAAALGELTATARAGRTSPADMAGGTFTITNVGVFGVDTGTPILNPGEAGILAVGAIKPTPWVVDGELAVRTVCQLALSFDHRLVDGEQGSRFLADVGALLTDPGLALTW
ncbi:dihydrolipoamide acetyltransferase family protein [Pseudonocardia hydrocarbonoxydans]|uniref:Dihydrolipoamide acetyltransferase component of pyruvate dehydrogenase complex n=1 Tax=Pseudonocardia hydrocarbonoxydans TaxID=76726 RepID=A0A4Y3WSK1_9PSEU|nr:dihydrolipoamide acetyltransferase family protein [Pseudonocardia hydrocarbonoxydans]GEC21508.1 dihydrolipoamide acetyltransferase component of pyruvate dehydrogenase complex [Pseudonocardia hydrocarbonoxydans]